MGGEGREELTCGPRDYILVRGLSCKCENCLRRLIAMAIGAERAVARCSGRPLVCLAPLLQRNCPVSTNALDAAALPG